MRGCIHICVHTCIKEYRITYTKRDLSSKRRWFRFMTVETGLKEKAVVMYSASVSHYLAVGQAEGDTVP
jgi:hypothetical protein